MTSFCVQYLSNPESPQLDVVGSFFTHDEPLDHVAQQAESLWPDGAAAFRILDMGGGVHAFKSFEPNSQAQFIGDGR